MGSQGQTQLSTHTHTAIPIRSILLIQANNMCLWHLGQLHQTAMQETCSTMLQHVGSGSDCVDSNPRSPTALLNALGQLIKIFFLFYIGV